MRRKKADCHWATGTNTPNSSQPTTKHTSTSTTTSSTKPTPNLAPSPTPNKTLLSVWKIEPTPTATTHRLASLTTLIIPTILTKYSVKNVLNLKTISRIKTLSYVNSRRKLKISWHKNLLSNKICPRNTLPHPTPIPKKLRTGKGNTSKSSISTKI